MGHRKHSALHTSIWRLGKVLKDHGPKIFQIETTLNTDMFPDAVRLHQQARVGVDRPATGRRSSASPRASNAHAARSARRKIFLNIESPHQMTSVQAGETEAVHKITLEHVYKQQLVTVEGQTDILTHGHPVRVPVQPRRRDEPDPGDVHGPRATCSTCTGTSRSSAREASSS